MGKIMTQRNGESVAEERCLNSAWERMPGIHLWRWGGRRGRGRRGEAGGEGEGGGGGVVGEGGGVSEVGG